MSKTTSFESANVLKSLTESVVVFLGFFKNTFCFSLVGGDDKDFVLLKEIKTEEEPPKPTRVEKSKTPRNSYYGNPEDSIPLLELHIKDGEPPLLNAQDEAQDTQPEETEKGARKVVDVYGDTSENYEKTFY